jgi:hypothetical protein
MKFRFGVYVTTEPAIDTDPVRPWLTAVMVRASPSGSTSLAST